MTKDKKSTAKDLLDRYSSNLIGIDMIEAERQALIDQVLTQEIKDKLWEIDEEINPKIEHLQRLNAVLEVQIREEVLRIGESVRGSDHTASWNKPRVSWNNEGLAGYALANPDIMVFQKVHKPTVTIRRRS